ncbi:MAG: hypothetical protein AMJ56_19095 [Anaerolineae bacterium SG8_19]|nr:MAG: hypothetical protein AMJ56_19095 [Anaerolineae bacterium SG8_19]
MKKTGLISLLLLLNVTAAVQAVTFKSDTLIDTNDYSCDGNDIIVDGCTLTVNGTHEFNSLQLINNSIITHSAATTGQPDYKINLTITQDVNISTGCKIMVDGKGYGSASGPGAGATGSYGGGAGHGGSGGRGRNGEAGGSTYGSITEPNDIGSGGGRSTWSGANGGPGGGAIRLTVGGTLTVNGSLTANGSNGLGARAGGGSGGSVYVDAGILAGTGIISANGGNATDNGGGGAGGRIAIYYIDATSFNLGNVTTNGGTGYEAGQRGSIPLIGWDSAPFITSTVPSGLLATEVNHVDVAFARCIEPNTFTGNDIHLLGPNGEIPISKIELVDEILGRQTYRVSFPYQSDGYYSLSIGPNITGINGKLLDQDRDGLYGEPIDDVYKDSFTIDTTGLRIIRHLTVGDTDGTDKHIYLWFAEPIDGTSFSVEDVNIRRVGEIGHSTSVGTMWLSQAGVIGDQYVIFDLGDSYDLESLRIWNYNESSWTGRGVKDMHVLVSPDNVTYTDWGLFTLKKGPGTDAYDFSQKIELVASGVRYVKFEINTNHGDASYVGFSEVNFLSDSEIIGVTIEDVSSEYTPDGRLAVHMVDGSGLMDIENNAQITINPFPNNCRKISFHSGATVNEVLIGPDIRDIAGNKMDQNGNGIHGEEPNDIYDASFTEEDVVVGAQRGQPR